MPKSSKSGSILNTSKSEGLSMINDARKRDALALAYVIYDLYKEELANGKVISGQNNAQSTSTN